MGIGAPASSPRFGAWESGWSVARRSVTNGPSAATVATARRQPEQAVSRKQVIELARQARRIAAARGTPQDIEWAIDTRGVVWIVQARPMTALPPDVSWASPARGAYTRQLRFGEWISEPVTPLFESWLLSDMEVRIHAEYLRLLGQRAPLPHHVIVNGWYFYSLNWLSPGSLARSLPGILVRVARNPKVATGVIPPTVRHAIPIVEREWRDDLQPRYRAAVAAAAARVETIPVDALPDLIDELVDLAGESFASITKLSGAAYKMEINLAGFYRRHLARTLGGSHLSLLAGIEPPAGLDRHAVVSLDWWYPSQPAEAAPPSGATRSLWKRARPPKPPHSRSWPTHPGVSARSATSSPKPSASSRCARNRPASSRCPGRSCAARCFGSGRQLVRLGAITAADDVFFLTRAEALAALRGSSLPATVDLAQRRATREEQATLVPPPFVGKVNRAIRAMPGAFTRMVGGSRSERALVTGSPGVTRTGDRFGAGHSGSE